VLQAIDAGENLNVVMPIACGGTEPYTAGRGKALLYD
jgi:hypothetical protein